MMEKEKNKLVTFYEKFKEPIAFISSILTVVFYFWTENGIFKHIFLAITFLFILLTVGYIVKSIFDTNKAKNILECSYIDKHQTNASDLHKFYHNLRIYSSHMYYLNKESINDKSHYLCDYISLFFETNMKDYIGNNSISVCIKLVEAESLMDSNYKNWRMQTIARSTSTGQNRFNEDKKIINICDNTDYQIILSEQYDDEYFASPNMSEIEQEFLNEYKLEYKNSRHDFKKHYMSTIVMPIKMDGRYITYTGNHTKQFGKIRDKCLILGFLCIDSKAVFKSESQRKAFMNMIEYAKTFADSLYMYYEKVLLLSVNKEK